MVRIQLLGPLRAWRGRDELDLGGPQQRAVLGLLAACGAAGDALSPSELIDVLWDDPPATGHNVVQTYVKRLRQLLEPDRPPRAPSRFLHRVSGGLKLSHVDLDLVSFRDLVDAARDALGLFRDIGERQQEADTLNHIGDAHHALGNPEDAAIAWQQALSTLEELEHPDAAKVRDKLRGT